MNCDWCRTFHYLDFGWGRNNVFALTGPGLQITVRALITGARRCQLADPVHDYELLARRFQEHRSLLMGVAMRILGSSIDADDAVQETWLRLSGSYPDHVENLPAWMTRIVTRVSLNMLRSRNSLREDLVDPLHCPAIAGPDGGGDPEDAALRNESISLALLTLRELLPPRERLAFVMHDMFAVPFEEIAPVMQRSTVAARKLASRARRRLMANAWSST
ncbi:sigma-70 family RNA polymerase sigma factor [Nonomuraea sp. NPDC050536]|uniref:sigma-70 family RNA polymerase sigma factor n=1 Tax=Nonomuraea sp. NPDC050536 TaxID=3364366 RepID=UPI0037CC4358